eukprot:SAG31_NODE_1011_length_10382_cov_8.910240_9_plen_55_part_00
MRDDAGVFFIGCHGYQLSVLLREQQRVALSPEERSAYEQGKGCYFLVFVQLFEK